MPLEIKNRTRTEAIIDAARLGIESCGASAKTIKPYRVKGVAGLILDLGVNVSSDVVIPELAWNIQEKVKQTIEEQAKLKVAKVNIHVLGVDYKAE